MYRGLIDMRRMKASEQAVYINIFRQKQQQQNNNKSVKN